MYKLKRACVNNKKYIILMWTANSEYILLCNGLNTCLIKLNYVYSGVRIVGGDTPFIVGHMAKLSCISDTVANKILWLENDNILAVSDSVHDQGVNHLNYTIHLVNDSIHGNIYTCQVQDASRDEMLTSVTTTISVTGN